MANRVLTLVVGAMCLALGGCFTSEQPKFSLSTAAPAFGDGGSYEVLERDKGDAYRHQEVFAIRHLGDGSYEFVNEKSEVLPISFHPLASDLYVGQAKPDKNKPDYGYVVVRMTGGEALVYVPQCDGQDKAKLEAFHVVLKDQYNCSIDSVANPVALFAALKLGDPTSKLVRQ